MQRLHELWATWKGRGSKTPKRSSSPATPDSFSSPSPQPLESPPNSLPKPSPQAYTSWSRRLEAQVYRDRLQKARAAVLAALECAGPEDFQLLQGKAQAYRDALRLFEKGPSDKTEDKP